MAIFKKGDIIERNNKKYLCVLCDDINVAFCLVTFYNNGSRETSWTDSFVASNNEPTHINYKLIGNINE